MRSPLLLLALASLASAIGGCQRAAIAQTTVPGRDLELAVYMGGFAEVRDTRQLALRSGSQRVTIDDVARTLDPQSVMFQWPANSGNEVASSVYDMGVEADGMVMNRYLGKEVELVYRGLDGRVADRQRGTLEAVAPQVVVRVDGRYLVQPAATLELPGTGDFSLRPRLAAEVESARGGTSTLTTQYAAGGLSWTADYTLLLGDDPKQANLDCWASVSNTSGTDFPDASIRFIAGSPRENLARNRGNMMDKAVAGSAAVADVEVSNAFGAPTSVGEMIEFPYRTKASIRQGQMNRVRMMGGTIQNVQQEYVVTLPGLGSWSAPESRQRATFSLRFQNDKASGLGDPLPGGQARVYTQDANGVRRFMGEATIPNTAAGTRVRLDVADAFEISATTKTIEAARVSPRQMRYRIQTTLANAKDRPVEVRVGQTFEGAFRILSESLPGAPNGARQHVWKVQVPAKGKTTLEFAASVQQ